MNPTTPASWDHLQTFERLKQLHGRLAAFRADRFSNEASFFENELRHILGDDSTAREIAEERFNETVEKLNRLLDQLNEITNQFEEQRMAVEHLGYHNGVPSRHSRLIAALDFLQRRPEYVFSLVNGPGPSLFTYRADDSGRLANDRVMEWEKMLQDLTANRPESQCLQSITPPAMRDPEGLSAEYEPDTLQRRASPVVNAIFKEFQKSRCAHEIKLGLSTLYIDPAAECLKVFISCCADATPGFGHEAECGPFK